MRRSWVVDTGLIVDWCLWHLADHGPDGLRIRATQRFSVLTLPDHRTVLEETLRSGKAVVVNQVTILEAGLRLQDLLSTKHRGPSDHLSPELVRAALAFFERFQVTTPRIERSMFRREVLDAYGPGDAVLVASLRDCSLLTADLDLWCWCREHDVDCVHFKQGELRER